MNKSAIRKFAIDARNELINKVSQKANEYGIEKDNISEITGNIINGIALEDRELNQRKGLIDQINAKSYDEVIEEIAYTWFNRFIALRFMEVNGYLPSRIKVFTNENNEFKPEILQEALHLPFDNINQSKIIELKESNQDDELFKYLLIAQCNELNKILPAMFQNISDYTELLFPDNLLRADSIIDRMIKEIPEDDFKDQVQIIGWLYQYYNTEPKDRVINIYKGNVAKKDIPAATQIFTPDWIVRYIVDNSLGRYWIERNPNSKLIEKLEYFIPSKSGEINYIQESIRPEEIKIYDPSIGSGHFPVYAFDILMEIYREVGYSDNQAVESILENNIYGLDIDERAYQLAYFSIIMKAREYSRRIFNKNINPNIYAFVDSDDINRNVLDINNGFDADEYKEIKKQLNNLLDDFIDAKNIGSILNTKGYDYALLEKYLDSFEDGDNLSFFGYEEDLEKISRIIQIAKVLNGKYHAVVTNPPYLNKMNPKLKKYVNDNYKDYKTDLFSVFMYKGFDNLVKDGYSGYMTPNVWMFIKSYEKLREYIINNKNISTLIQVAKGSFYSEATVDVMCFTLKNIKDDIPGVYIRLEDFAKNMDVQKEKVLESLQNIKNYKFVYEINLDYFERIPGSPIAYWANKAVFDAYNKGKIIDDLLDVKVGLQTGANDRFIRFWWEVDINKCKFDSINESDLLESGKKWVPYNKGGKRRQWYGNYDYLVNWENDGFEIKHFVDDRGRLKSRPQNIEYYFKEAITWGLITSGGFSIRYRTHGGIHDVSGMSAFSANDKRLKEILGILSTPIADYIFKILNPTINLQVGDFKNFPIIDFNEENKEIMSDLVDENIDIAKNDWDSYEESWDFRNHFLVNNTNIIRESFDIWNKKNRDRFERLKNNEEMIDKIVIDAYGLDEVVPYEISDEDITLNKANLTLDIKSLISYFIGCYMGRYSLDREGVIFAGGDFDPSKYTTFKADENGIIPIIDNEYFDDDVVTKFIDFIKVVYGEETLEENLQFIADALGGTGTARDVIRQYFIKDFYKDHLKTYQKRPIYWLFDSGKKNAFKALIYMHRYEKDTIAKIRTEYIHEYQDKYAETIKSIESSIETAGTSDKVRLNKELKDLKDKAEELRLYEEKIHHLADQMIEIDLDDGVEHNYELFRDVLAERK